MTGKTHQIRAHLSYMGHPILGDPKYGDQEMNRKYKLRSQLLHAYRLEFPRTEGPLAKLSEKKFVAPLPESFLKICRQQEVDL